MTKSKDYWVCDVCDEKGTELSLVGEYVTNLCRKHRREWALFCMHNEQYLNFQRLLATRQAKECGVCGNAHDLHWEDIVTADREYQAAKRVMFYVAEGWLEGKIKEEKESKE